ncbi:Thaumatin family [Dillenia turbinata]|uniref:Thaumatin family n=1 Tax=Dillenia turbinata TaxID=194707 RepID=A0AAN8VJ24_9MAGN
MEVYEIENGIAGHGVTGTIELHASKKCPFPIWPATAPNSDRPVIANGGWPPAWPDPKHLGPSNMDWQHLGSNYLQLWKPACQTGDCDGGLACDGTLGVPSATLIEFSFGPDRTKPSFDDASLVDGFCCKNEYGSPERCKAKVYSKLFKEACPSYFSYVFDSPPPLVNFASREYVITFSPSKWGLNDM